MKQLPKRSSVSSCNLSNLKDGKRIVEDPRADNFLWRRADFALAAFTYLDSPERYRAWKENYIKKIQEEVKEQLGAEADRAKKSGTVPKETRPPRKILEEWFVYYYCLSEEEAQTFLKKQSWAHRLDSLVGLFLGMGGERTVRRHLKKLEERKRQLSPRDRK